MERNVPVRNFDGDTPHYVRKYKYTGGDMIYFETNQCNNGIIYMLRKEIILEKKRSLIYSTEVVRPSQKAAIVPTPHHKNSSTLPCPRRI